MRAKSISVFLGLVTTLACLPPTATAGPFHLSFGVTVGTRLPDQAVRVRVDRERFLQFHGSFYQKVTQGYILVAAPAGVQVKELPRGAIHFTFEGADYYHHAGVCYKPLRRGFEVCAIPDGARAEIRRVEATAENQILVRKDGQELIFRGGVFFRNAPDGLEVEMIPIGAVAKDFPPDAMSVWFQSTEFLEANGVFFREVPGGYQVTTAPWPNAWEIASAH